LGGGVSSHKKVLISLPEALLRDADEAAAKEGINRSEFIRRAMRQSLDRMHTMETRELLRRGYEEMAGINLEWSEHGLSQDKKILEAYEENLSECE
jgi:CopG family transcriptional regulator/antitoxin EndoAI